MSRFLTVLATLLVATTAIAAAPSSAPPAGTEDPVHRWVAAFNAGAAALSAFYEAELHPALKTKRSVAERMANYAQSRASVGDLKVLSLTQRPGGWRAQLQGKDAIQLDGEFEIKEGKIIDMKLQAYTCHGGGHGCGPQSKPVERGGPTQ